MERGYPGIDDAVCVIGLGYVGIPLLVEILKESSNRKIYGFDICEVKISELSNGESLKEYGYDGCMANFIGNNDLTLTSDTNRLSEPSIFILAVPTPVDDANTPDLSYMHRATAAIIDSNRDKVSKNYKVIIYESTVYPGASREIFTEHTDNLNRESTYFKFGYSPERINPGDKENTLTKIVKITSGEDIDSRLG